MKKTLKFLFIGIMATSFLSINAQNSFPSLKKIMQDLERDMAELGKGIYYEDFKVIKRAADNIAHHPRAKDQLPTVIKTLNVRMPKFKGYDTKVHEAAKSIVKLAKENDIQKIVEKQEVIVRNCVACHSQFRDELSDALSKD